MSIHEQARAEAEKAFPAIFDDTDALTYPRSALREFKRGAYERGFLAGHEAATRTRVVTTVTELDALPIGSVVLDRLLNPWHLRGAGRWYAAGWDGGVLSPAVPLPARVLYDPEETR